MKKITLMTLITSLITGCSSTEQLDLKNTNTEINYNMIALEEQKKLYTNMQEIASKALKAQRVRQQVQNATSIQLMDADKVREANWQASYTPVGMERELTIDWSGAPEPLLRTLAQHSDYTIDFENKPYPIAKDIYIYPERQNIKQLLDEIDRQTKGYINRIEIYEDLKLIKAIYQEH